MNNDNRSTKKTKSYEAFFSVDDHELTEYKDLIANSNPDNLNEDVNSGKKKLSKKKRIIIISGIIISVLLIIYLFGLFFFMNRFVPGTYINGINVGFKTNQDAVNALNNSAMQREVTIIGSNNEMNKVTGAEIDLRFADINGLDNLIKRQNKFLWPFDWMFPSFNDLTTAYNYSDEELDSTVQSLSLVSGRDVTEPINAVFVYNGNEFSIQPSVMGTKPNVSKLEKAIVEALVDNIPSINLAQDNLYQEADLTENSPIMQSNLEKLNQAVKSTITINFPNSPVILNKDTFSSWLIADDNGVSLNKTSLNDYVSQLASQYNTAGRTYSFKSTKGTTYNFQNNNGGFILNQEAEASQLNDQILSGTETSENPIWSQANGGYILGNQITGSYIEVSLVDQTLWLYKNNTLISSCTIVSGNTSTNESTRTGLYYIKSKNLNTTQLVRMPDGSIQNVSVSYWFPYTDTVGFESANFRQQFGGNIYINQGTNGDIDIPVEMGSTLNSNIDINYPVVIY